MMIIPSKMSSSKRSTEEIPTNIRVAVRVRPLNRAEQAEKSVSAVKVDRQKNSIFTKMKTFGPFSKVYDTDATQQMVYEDLVAGQVKKVIAGFNCTVFAYGQTGTGKTFTMEGGQQSEETKSWRDDPTTGIIPRAVEDIFEQLDQMGCEEYSLRVSYIELYNEELYDLLAANSVGEDRERLKIFEDPTKKGVIVSGVEEVPVRNRADVYKLLKLGAEKRRTATTLMNINSSRSHSLFMVSVVIRENTATGDELVKQGKLNLVDLAGSENVSRSGAEGKRAKEAGNINQSLLTLGRVIRALTTSGPHVPYRESKLTRLLQDSLGGSTITSLIATLSPASSNIEESVSTLEYAIRAANIKNRPVCNTKVSRKAILKTFSDEIEKLRRDLRAAREKTGVHLSEESHEELLRNTERMQELEEQLDATVDQLRRFTEDLVYMDEQYRLLYERKERLEDKLAQRIRQIAEKEKELDDKQKELDIHKSALQEMHSSALITFSQLKEMRDSADNMSVDLALFWDKVDQMDLVAFRNKSAANTVSEKVAIALDDISKTSQNMEASSKPFMVTEVAENTQCTTSLRSTFTSIQNNIAAFSKNVQHNVEEDSRIYSDFFGDCLGAETQICTMLNTNMDNFKGLFSQFMVDVIAVTEDLKDRINRVKAEMNNLQMELSPLLEERRAAIELQAKQRKETRDSYVKAQVLRIQQLQVLVSQLAQGLTSVGASTADFDERGEVLDAQLRDDGAAALEALEAVATSHDDVVSEVVDGVDDISEKAAGRWASLIKEATDVAENVVAMGGRTLDEAKKTCEDVSTMLASCDEQVVARNAALLDRMASLEGIISSSTSSISSVISGAKNTMISRKWEDVDINQGVPPRNIPAILGASDMVGPPEPNDLLFEEKDQRSEKRVSNYAPRESLLDMSNKLLSPATIRTHREFATIEEENIPQ
ncbi:unnamed protein product [Caenorhabditis auriculariae]|uniref:Kinesin-like protein n=1 Tax=Caenorhabditis auriculariae TaxID=2777116 RepID=A0A8S1GYZ9_9PELO|nr:unnamed protein product [Caenorhabditis auriculariae]